MNSVFSISALLRRQISAGKAVRGTTGNYVSGWQAIQAKKREFGKKPPEPVPATPPPMFEGVPRMGGKF